MAKDKGWVKIYRDIQSHWIWTDKPFSMGQAWIDLLLMANHEDVKFVFNGSMTTVKAGQTITSVRKLAERWGWGNEKTLKFLRELSSDGMIEKDSDNNRTLITIVKYKDYQVVENTNRTRTERKPNTDRNTSRTRTEHKQERERMIKNEEEGKEIYMPSADSDSDDEGWMDPMELQKMMNERGKS